MLGVEDWAEIRRLRRAEGMAISEIARVLGISRNTVRSALASEGPPRYVRRPVGSVVDAFELRAVPAQCLSAARCPQPLRDSDLPTARPPQVTSRHLERKSRQMQVPGRVADG